MFDPNTLNQKMATLGVKFVNGKANIDHLHKVAINDSVVQEAKEWCESYFKNKWLWGTPLGAGTSRPTTFYFLNEEDLLFFKMKYLGFAITS